jgi:hypothetical protein
MRHCSSLTTSAKDDGKQVMKLCFVFANLGVGCKGISEDILEHFD